MAIHKWRKVSTRHFGKVWVPLAQVDLRTAQGSFKSFALQIDSGAVVSLLRKSTAASLGISLESGRKIDLSSVGGGGTTAFVHIIQTRFDDGIEFPVPYAIAEKETVPNLLGRLGVFDQLQIHFDGQCMETRISDHLMR